MKQIAIGDWTESADRRFDVVESGSAAALTVDAALEFVDCRPTAIVRCEHDDPHGPVRVAWRNDVAEGHVSAQEVGPGVLVFRCECRITQDVVSSGIGWSFQLHAASPRVLSSNYQMVTLGQSQRQSGLTPMALQARAERRCIGVLSPDSRIGHDWQLSEAGRVMGTLWFDHPLAHPRFTFEGPQFRNWHNRYRFRSSTVLRRELYVMITDRPTPLLVPGRYPGRRRAVFSITDHADHDSCERLAALWYGSSRDAVAKPSASSSLTPRAAGFVGLRLPFTKSVFTATPQADGPGLHCAPFAQLCREGHAAGIEICPHGVHSTVQPAVSEIEELLAPFAEFQPLTWIDHGNRFLSNYGRRGWNPDDEYTLLPWLDRLGIKYVWGRLDFGQSLPLGRLDQVDVHRFRGWSYMRDMPKHIVRSLAIGRPWAVLHGASSLAFQLVPEPTMQQYFLAQRFIQRVMKADVSAIPGAVWQSSKIFAALMLPPGIFELARHFRGQREEVSRSPIFYPEHDAVYRGMDDRWLFNTIAVHDVAAAYSPAVIDRLVDDYGIHLSHTYLTSVSRAHVSHAIEPDGPQHWRLTAAFDHNLKNLAQRRDDGQLWVASMGEIGEFWRRCHSVRLLPLGGGRWQLSSPHSTPSNELDLQVIVIGSADKCCVENGHMDLQPMHDGMQFGSVPLRSGSNVLMECHA